MKVLFITVRADLGGGPEHLYQLLAHAPAGMDIRVACPEDDPYHGRYMALLGAGRVVPIPHRAFTLEALFRLARLVRKDSIDIVHSHGKGAGLYARALAAITRARAVHTFHGLHVGEYGAAKKALYLGLELLMGCVTQRGICVSASEADAIGAARLVRAGRLVTIPNGVMVPNVVSAAPLSGDAPLRIIAVNRYDHQKNPDLLLDLACALKGRRAFRMTVLGTGERLDEMRARVRAERLENHVTLQGGVSEPRKFMAGAHVFVSTSRWEGMPLAVLEAMSEGLCPVVTDVPGNSDLVTHDVNGLLYNTAQEGADLLAVLDGPHCTRLSSRARRTVEDAYSVQRMAERTYAVLEKAAGDGL